MSIKEYTFIEPHGPFGEELRAWIRRQPARAARLFDAVDSFVLTTLDLSCLLTDGDRSGLEIYLVPPALALATSPDSACLCRVDHAAGTFELVHLVEDYGGAGEGQQRSQIRIVAQGLL